MSEATMKENTVEVEAAERPYALRKLKDGDLVPLLSLFRKLGLKQYKSVISKAVSAAHGGSDTLSVGIDVFLEIGDVVISNLEGAAGEAIYEFYSDMSGLSVEEIKDMEFGTLPMMIYDSFAEVKNASFFKVLAKLL